MKRTYEFKSIHHDKGVFLVVKFYRSPNLGECHAGYLYVAAPSEGDAIEIARREM